MLIIKDESPINCQLGIRKTKPEDQHAHASNNNTLIKTYKQPEVNCTGFCAGVGNFPLDRVLGFR